MDGVPRSRVPRDARWVERYRSTSYGSRSSWRRLAAARGAPRDARAFPAGGKSTALVVPQSEMMKMIVLTIRCFGDQDFNEERRRRRSKENDVGAREGGR